MFFPQQPCECKLGPIISNCIRSDQELHCVKNPFACGYISWMTNLHEVNGCQYHYNCQCNKDYPYNT